jgi:hypothetical protein
MWWVSKAQRAASASACVYISDYGNRKLIVNANVVMAEEGRNMLSLCGRGVSSHSENVHVPFLEASRRGVSGFLDHHRLLRC